MTDLALRTQNLAKAYRIGVADEDHDTFVSAAWSRLKSPLRNLRRLNRLGNLRRDLDSDDVVWALRDIDMSVARGEVVGIIGRNGAGKSTLLKILSRITLPTAGRAEVFGRIGSLLEVGTGFHPELTGRENVYLNGTILGMSKREIDLKFDEIVAFAEVERFIDTPIKRYSSGMGVRLAFSVAAHLDPEILLIDEVLAVGDADFQRKCLGQMSSVAQAGRTVLFVSHNMGAVESLCHRIIVLEEGRIVYSGETGPGIKTYLSNAMQRHDTIEVEDLPRVLDTHPVIKKVRVRAADGSPTRSFQLGDDVVFEIDVDPGDEVVPQAMMSIGFFTAMGQEVVLLQSDLQSALTQRIDGPYTFRCRVSDVCLTPGEYPLQLVLYGGRAVVDRIDDAVSVEIRVSDLHGNGQAGRLIRGIWQVRGDWEGRVQDTTAS